MLCGFFAVALAAHVSSLATAPDNPEALLAAVTDAAAVIPLVEVLLGRTLAAREAFALAHGYSAPEVSAYKRDLVSNFEVSDLLRSLGDAASRIVFVRLNQVPQYQWARGEERVRMVEELPFGGKEGGKGQPSCFSAPGDSMFIIEDFSPPEGSRLLRPDHPSVHAGAWRAAVVDLSGHFSMGCACGGDFYLVNTTQDNSLRFTGLLSSAMASDVLLKRGAAAVPLPVAEPYEAPAAQPLLLSLEDKHPAGEGAAGTAVGGGAAIASGAAHLTVGGSAVCLDHLGPIIINSDGTTSRILGWEEKSEEEKESVKRLVAKRNAKRLALLKERMPSDEK